MQLYFRSCETGLVQDFLMKFVQTSPKLIHLDKVSACNSFFC